MNPGNTTQTNDEQMIPIDGGKFNVWTKRVGSGDVKILLLHGGPGATSGYFKCFEQFLPPEEFTFYYYDQLGSYHSHQPDNASLWRLSRFVEEVEEVRRALNLENFYLYGQSWGALLATEYALKYGQNLKGLILSNMTASIESYEKYAAELRRELPADIIEILDKYEAVNDFENPEYQAAMFGSVYAKHFCRLPEFPAPLADAFQKLNHQVYQTMQGPNEFVISGNLKNWDKWKDLPRIETPTLVIGARYDTMNPEDLQKMSELMPNARLAICENGSHLTLYDDQECYFRHLLEFLRANERRMKMR
jgi:proline iminopeptidase